MNQSNQGNRYFSVPAEFHLKELADSDRPSSGTSPPTNRCHFLGIEASPTLSREISRIDGLQSLGLYNSGVEWM
jgi:hypothetical protein